MKGDLEVKRSILLGMGQNPTVYDGKVQIIPNDWFVPIQKSYPQLESQYVRVKTAKKQQL